MATITSTAPLAALSSLNQNDDRSYLSSLRQCPLSVQQKPHSSSYSLRAYSKSLKHIVARCSQNAQLDSRVERKQASTLPGTLGLVSAAVVGNAIIGGAALAGDVATAVAEISPFTFALAGGGAIAALTAALTLTDPENRRQQQAAAAGGNEKDVVRNYFDTSGFDRWRRIYGETDDVNKVQLDIRVGHAQTVEKVLGWLKSEGSLEGVTICDAGCGTGSLAIPLAVEGAQVSASDISSAMVGEAAKRAEVALKEAGRGVKPQFEASDLESLSGKYHTVTCLDVFIHYPQDKAGAMIGHLASLAEKRLVISFAPYTPYYAILKRIGELFPGPSKATRAYLHAEADVEAALEKVGWRVTRREMTATSFYFSRLLEAVPISSS